MSVKHDAITAFVQECQSDAVVTKFVMVAEVIGSDGKRYLWTDTHDEATPWDCKGILLHALDEMCSEDE